MESINKTLSQWAEHFNLTRLDEEPEPYILTKEEEDEVLEHELISAKKHMAYKMGLVFKTEAEIMQKLSEVNWDAKIDREEILRRANSNKISDQWHKEQEEKEKLAEKEKREEIKRTWTAKQFYKLMRWSSLSEFGKELIVNDDTMPLIKALCFFLSEDERFETELGYTFQKGLMIRGVCGLGKTHLVKCVKNNPRSPISVFSMIEISEEVRLSGEFGMDFFNKVYIDDVGSEVSPVKFYGTEINWFKDFMEKYYLRKTQYNKLIVSTNINFAEMEEKYGFRFRSRAKDMFNVIDVTGKDLRG